MGALTSRLRELIWKGLLLGVVHTFKTRRLHLTGFAGASFFYL